MIEALLPILARAGAGVLADVVRTHVPGPVASVVTAIAEEIGASPTPKAIAEAWQQAPASVEAGIAKVATEHAEYWQGLAAEARKAAELFAREDARETFFSWGWRPAMSWIVIAMIAWRVFAGPIVNALLPVAIELTPWEYVLAIMATWTAIYGGGHTVKAVFGDRLKVAPGVGT